MGIILICIILHIEFYLRRCDLLFKQQPMQFADFLQFLGHWESRIKSSHSNCGAQKTNTKFVNLKKDLFYSDLELRKVSSRFLLANVLKKINK